MRGVLIWKMPKAKDLAVRMGETVPITTNERNKLARELLGNNVIGINHVVILVDGQYYYIIKNKITGARGNGIVSDLGKFIEELEAISE